MENSRFKTRPLFCDKGKEIRKKVMGVRYQEIKSILKKLEKDELQELVQTIKRSSEILKKVI